jgi:protocatechuate 3,4-dioxygenase beta subunit
MWSVASLRRRAFLTAVVAAIPVTFSGNQSAEQVAGRGVGAISGVVVDGTSGRPIGNAVVYLSPEGRDGAVPFERQQSDALGRFVFPDLPGATTYSLRATGLGFLSSDEGPASALAVGRIVLGDGQWVRDARLALWPPAALSGTVLDEQGEPVTGAYVRAWRKGHAAGHDILVGASLTMTNDLGTYRLDNLPKGTYVVGVLSVQESVQSDSLQAALNGLAPEVAARQPPLAPISGIAISGDATMRVLVGRYGVAPVLGPGQPRAYPAQYFSGMANTRDAAPVSVDYGENREGIDFHLQPVPVWRLAGVVHGASDHVGGLLVRLVPNGNEGLGAGAETASARVGGDGRFVLLNVPTGQYMLLVTPGMGEFGMLPSTLSVRAGIRTRLPRPSGGGGFSIRVPSPTDSLMFTWVVPTGGDGISWARESVNVSDHDVDNLEIQLVPGGSITGQLVLESGSEPPINPYAGLAVEPSLENVILVMPGLTVAPALDRAAPWHSPRHFEIRGLTPGRYGLRTVSPDAVIKSIEWHGHDYADDPFDLSGGSGFSDVMVTITTRVASLTGRVRDANGVSLAGATVIYFPTDRDAWRKYGLGSSRMGTVSTSSDGVFTARGLRAGEYALVAVPGIQRALWQDADFLDVASRVATRIQVDWGGTARLDLRVEAVKTP